MSTFPCYHMNKNTLGQWYWIYYAANGEAIARSSESYFNKQDCRHGIDLIANSKGNPVYEE